MDKLSQHDLIMFQSCECLLKSGDYGRKSATVSTHWSSCSSCEIDMCLESLSCCSMNLSPHRCKPEGVCLWQKEWYFHLVIIPTTIFHPSVTTMHLEPGSISKNDFFPQQCTKKDDMSKSRSNTSGCYWSTNKMLGFRQPWLLLCLRWLIDVVGACRSPVPGLSLCQTFWTSVDNKQKLTFPQQAILLMTMVKEVTLITPAKNTVLFFFKWMLATT